MTRVKHFLRIDDVGKSQYQKACMSEILRDLLERDIASVLGVIPQELEAETVAELKLLEQEKPGLIDIAMHGDTHDLIEFSEAKDYASQLNSIEAGRHRLEDNFGISPAVFIPPEHILTNDTIKALDASGFKLLSKQFKPSIDGWIFYTLGKLLKRWVLLGKKISFHSGAVTKTSMKEVSISIELAQNHVVKSTAQILTEYKNALKYTNVVGFLIHPQLLSDQDNRKRFDEFLNLIVRENWNFYTLSHFTA